MPSTIGTEWRTLTINTTGNYTFHGEVLSHLNLVKQGSGTQTLAGTSSIFNGALTVQGGTLTLSGNAIGMLSTAAAVRIESGAELHLSACAADTLYHLPGNLSNEGTLAFNYDISGNGAAFDFTGFGGEIRLDKGLVQLSMSVFDDEVSPTFVVKSANGQFCFNGEGTEARANLVLDATTKVHVNNGKSGIPPALANSIRIFSVRPMKTAALSANMTSWCCEMPATITSSASSGTSCVMFWPNRQALPTMRRWCRRWCI